MALIQAYKFNPQGLEQENGKSAQHWEKTCKKGGFNPYTQELTPFVDPTAEDTYTVLDTLTAASEAGVIDAEKWVSQLFASATALEAWLTALEDFDSFARIYDRSYQALLLIVRRSNEEGFVTSKEIADGLRIAAEETEQV